MRGLRRLMVYAAAAATPLSVLVALAAPTAAHAATTTGTVELCKSGANGMTGKTFDFTITGLQGRSNPVAVTGGGCSSALKVTSGHQTVTETATGLPAGDTVSAITTSPSGDLVSKNLSGRSAVINVRAGSTTSNETVVHYTNLVPPAQIKVCKAAATGSGLVGQSFTFTENNGAPFSVIAGTTSAPNCSGLTTYQSGTRVNVAEQATPGVEVTSIVTSGAGTASNESLSGGTITETLKPGVTIVTYTNAPIPPPSYGLLEVCKQASDPYVTGSFQFTVTDGTYTNSFALSPSQCTPALTVPAGQATVTETEVSPYYLSNVSTIPSGDLVSQNDANGSAVVTVVKSTSDETQVTFTNDTLTNEAKICKTLTANSTALAYQPFTFNITDADGSTTETVVAGAAGSTVCQLITAYPGGPIVWLPIGSKVTVTEQGQASVQNTSVVVSPSSQDLGSAPPTANFTVGGPSVITQATFTNEALSQIEICKTVTTYAPTNESFAFTITDSGTTITESVPANSCTQGITVPAGTATVTETELPNFVLQGISVSGSGSEVSQSGTSVTVTVPFAGDTGVTFTNTVATGSFKVCKVVPSQYLGYFQGIGATWNFTWSYTANGQVVTGGATLAAGQCSLIQSGIPVVDQNGNPTQITVDEAPSAVSVLQGVTVSDGSLISQNDALQMATFSMLPNPTNGITVATFTNTIPPVIPAD